MITLFLPHHPTPWQAPRLGRGLAYNPKSKEKKSAIHMIDQLYNGPVIKDFTKILFTFLFQPPKTASKKQRQRMLDREIFPTRCDCTNLQKFYEDCLKKIVIEDDRYVQSVSSEKFYNEQDAVLIKIFTLQELQDASEKRNI